MISYNEAKEQARQELNIVIPESIPKKEYQFYAYKNGTCTTFDNEKDAKNFSLLYEKNVTNKDEIDKYWETLKTLDRKAIEIWHSALREEWSELSTELFDVCYSQAYERGHSSGYDEVANLMYDIVEFAQRILSVKKYEALHKMAQNEEELGLDW